MPYSDAFGDFYYSRADGRAESRHVFLAGNGLPERFSGRDHFVIAELGFGTGLNFIETWRAWETFAAHGEQLDYHSFELYPMKRDEILRALSAWPEIAGEAQALAAAWPDDPSGDMTLSFEAGKASVCLHIHIGHVLERLAGTNLATDAWYLDGFAPSRNPEMWSAELMRLVASKTAKGGTFATYSAAGWVRRNLEAAGFRVEKRPGHAGKRDMSVGVLGDNR